MVGPRHLFSGVTILWGEHSPPASATAQQQDISPPVKADGINEVRAAPSSGALSAAQKPDLDAIARRAPILFSGGGGEGRGDSAGSVPELPRGATSGFTTSQSSAEDDRLPTKLNPPRSPYELLAGDVISAALLTELNSDLPGRVIAQVTSSVYDTVSGKHLLIPQGTRLIGVYDSPPSHGDHRILLKWSRMVMPNGWSINLQGMEAADPSGAAGLRDRSDYHLGPLAGAIGLSAIISVIANNAQDKTDKGDLNQSLGDAAAQEAARTGGKLIDRQLQLRPTLRVRVGAPVRVLVTRDMELKPYRDAAP